MNSQTFYVIAAFILGCGLGWMVKPETEHDPSLEGASVKTEGWFKKDGTPATLAPTLTDETGTGPIMLSGSLGVPQEYFPIKAIYFNENTQRLMIVLDSGNHIAIRQIGPSDIFYKASK